MCDVEFFFWSFLVQFLRWCDFASAVAREHKKYGMVLYHISLYDVREMHHRYYLPLHYFF